MLKRWCGNVYSTSEGNYQLHYQTGLTTYKQKGVLAAMLEGKSMPPSMAAKLFVEKSKCHKISPLNAFPLKFRV